MTKPSPSLLREQQLAHWAAAQLQSKSPLTLRSIASDAGFRRYFRFSTPSRWLAVDAPPQTEDTRQFVALARYLHSQGIHTPEILAADEAQGLLLVEDFGDELLYRKLSPSNVAELYGLAFDTLTSLHQCAPAPELIPAYDQPLLRRELHIFSEWFVTNLLGYSLSASETAMLEQLFNMLEQSALTQPQTLVHRDFHSRNLIMCEQPQPAGLGVIDFQGALWGACTYDLVSLLRDCYLRWPAAEATQWALAYRQRAIAAGLLAEHVSEAQYLQWFDWMGLQRHIKVLGIFARLHLRDHKPHYLQDLPLVIRYTLEVANNYPELQEFAAWFSTKLLPLITQQAWYSPYQYAGDKP